MIKVPTILTSNFPNVSTDLIAIVCDQFPKALSIATQTHSTVWVQHQSNPIGFEAGYLPCMEENGVLTKVVIVGHSCGNILDVDYVVCGEVCYMFNAKTGRFVEMTGNANPFMGGEE